MRDESRINALPGYDPEIGRWLWALEDTRRRTKRSLEGLQQMVIDWPHPLTPSPEVELHTSGEGESDSPLLTTAVSSSGEGSGVRPGNSIGTLLYHIAAIEIDWLYADVLEGKSWPPEVEALFPYDVRDEQGRLIAVPGLSLEDHVRRLDAVRSIFLASFRGMSIDEFRRVRHFADYDVTPEWVIHHLMQHEAEHRGQIGELRIRAEQALADRENIT